MERVDRPITSIFSPFTPSLLKLNYAPANYLIAFTEWGIDSFCSIYSCMLNRAVNVIEQ